MKNTLTSLLSALILAFSGCIYADTDVNVEVSVNIEIEASANMDDMNVTAQIEADVCGIVETLDPEPEESDDPDKLGNWESCETPDQCESGLCICYVCLDIRHFLPN